MAEKRMSAEASKEFLTHKLNVHLDLWAAEKWQLENLLFMGERAHNHREVIQAYENAQLGVTLGFQQQELLLANTKLESALDDLLNCQTRVTTLQAQLQREKDNAKWLEEQIQSLEACISSREAEHAGKLADAEHKLQTAEGIIQDLQQQAYTMKQRHEAEMMEEKANAANCNAKVSKDIESLLRERDFVWNQLKCMEADYCGQIKVKDELLESAKAEIARLQEQKETSQRAADEREVELTVLRVQLEKAEESLPADKLHDQVAEKEEELRQALRRLEEVRLENDNLRVLYAELEAKHDTQQRQDKQTRTSRKDPTTRNLSSELDAVAEAPGEHRKRSSVTRKKREEKSRMGAKRMRSEDGRGKRRQTESSSRKALTSRRGEDENVMKNSLFSSSFSIPKVKDLSSLR